MRLSGFGVIAEFRLPPGAPEAVQEAQERFEHVAERYALHQGRIEDGERDVEAAKQLDAERSLERAMSDDDLGDVNEYEREARAKLDILRRALAPLEQALDQAGNAMVGPIAEAAESWAAELDAEAREAAGRYAEAVAEAMAALGDMGRLRSAVAWLRAFDRSEAITGNAGGGWTGKVMAPAVTVEDHLGRQFDARELLQQAALASEGSLQSLEEQRQARHEAAQAAREAELAELRAERGR